MQIDITDKTRIPLFVVLSTMPVLVVAIFWIASLGSRVAASEQRQDRVVDKIHTMEAKEDKVLEGIGDIRERLSRIEERLRK